MPNAYYGAMPQQGRRDRWQYWKKKRLTLPETELQSLANNSMQTKRPPVKQIQNQPGNVTISMFLKEERMARRLIKIILERDKLSGSRVVLAAQRQGRSRTD